jgi:hypothetical protein
MMQILDGLAGEIESAHRYVVQQRLKRPGARGGASNRPHDN